MSNSTLAVTSAEEAGIVSGRLGEVVPGHTHEIGDGFTALHFSEEMFGGSMDPLLMVDDFVMTAPTFEPHLHAGISAVTAMFEDSEGAFINRDTLGHNIGLQAGDLYWLTAASGAVHEEHPEEGARIHALQIFVNLPAHLKKEGARALHVKAGEVPLLEGNGYRMRVLLGRSATVVGSERTPPDMTMLDGLMEKGACFAHHLLGEQQAWIYAASGSLTIRCGDENRTLKAGSATTIRAGAGIEVVFNSSEPSHFVFIAGRPVAEPFIKHGPLVMSTVADIRRTLVGYANGEFGRIPT
ncbi:pirin-like protein [Janthinobacterium sp. Marseille]|nr:pirin-like C-terminal cupin domain-containing protein [Janthinobacterium sp. Marseille]ABR91476.1 pirin-like protein [Janthinobacterium sp. Marseille]